MKSIDEAEAQARLDEILDEVQRQPIVIRRPRVGITGEAGIGAGRDRTMYAENTSVIVRKRFRIKNL